MIMDLGGTLHGLPVSVLACPPEHYDVNYTINPWMDQSSSVDAPAAQREWSAVVTRLGELGVTVRTVRPLPGLPDMVFARDAGLHTGETFIPSNFAHPERSGEVVEYVRWMNAHGIHCQAPPAESFESGDVVITERATFIAIGPRTSAAAAEDVAARLRAERATTVVTVRLVADHYYHLGTALQPLPGGGAIAVFSGLDEESVAAIKKHFDWIVEPTQEPVDAFLANGVIVGDRVLVHGASSEAERALERRGLQIERCPVPEFLKAGGSIRCMLMALLGPIECAASELIPCS